MPQPDQTLAHPAAWRGPSLFERADWDVVLTERDCAELTRALSRTTHLTPEELTKDNFALPELSHRLAAIQDSLETGSGATRIRGLALQNLSEHEVERLFWGLALHVGTPVSQSASGERLLHVRDEGFAPEDPRFRGPHSNRRLSFHTDRCDVIAFLCVRPASMGGENDVISSVTLYNEMRTRHPDALQVLRQPFPYLRHTVDSGNERAYTTVPVFTVHEDHFAASFLRVLIDRADRDPSAPGLTDSQRAALASLEAVAEDSSLFARFRLDTGDLLLLNNWVTFHRRTAFEDHPDPGIRCHPCTELPLCHCRECTARARLVFRIESGRHCYCVTGGDPNRPAIIALDCASGIGHRCLPRHVCLAGTVSICDLVRGGGRGVNFAPTK